MVNSSITVVSTPIIEEFKYLDLKQIEMSYSVEYGDPEMYMIYYSNGTIPSNIPHHYINLTDIFLSKNEYNQGINMSICLFIILIDPNCLEIQFLVSKYSNDSLLITSTANCFLEFNSLKIEFNNFFMEERDFTIYKNEKYVALFGLIPGQTYRINIVFRNCVCDFKEFNFKMPKSTIYSKIRANKAIQSMDK